MYRTSAFFPLLRRFTALLLTAALLFLFLPPSPVTFAEGNTAELLSASGYDFTSNGYIAGKLQELFDLLPYSDYPYFTVTGNTSCGNNWCSSCMGANVARQHPNLKALGICDPHTCWSCFAFARYATLYIFGITADGLNYYGNVTPGGNLQRVGRIARSGIGNVDGAYDAYTRENLLSIIKKAAPGDIIQANGSAGSGNHTMIYLGHDDSGVFVLHDNMFKSNTGADGKPYGFNRVLVSKISYESMMSYWGNIISVLRVRQDAWSAAWNSSGSVCKTHTFTEAGGDRCTVCGYKFKAAHDPSAAGLYETVTVSTLRPSPYFSSGGSEIVQRGKRLAVAAALKNSIGETWYLLTNGEYTHGDNLKKTDAPADGAPEIAMVSYPSASHKKGSAFDLSGSITGKSALSEVCGMLISDDGSERQQVTVAPGSTRMDVYSSNINYSLKFGALKEGGWRFLLSAKDGEGRLSLFESRFTVGDGGGGYTPPAPGAPSLSGKTADSVTLVMVSGLEYRMEGGEWQKSNLFTGLSPATAYRFYARVAATENAPASLPGGALTVTTSDRSEIVLPPPVLASRTDSSVTLKAEDGFEYSMDGAVWQNDPVFTGLASRTAYFFYKRLKAEPSSVSTALAVTTDMPTPAPPSAAGSVLPRRDRAAV